jgi:hypothetical protein
MPHFARCYHARRIWHAHAIGKNSSRCGARRPGSPERSPRRQGRTPEQKVGSATSRARISLKLARKMPQLPQTILQRTHYPPARTRNKKRRRIFDPSGAHFFCADLVGKRMRGSAIGTRDTSSRDRAPCLGKLRCSNRSTFSRI